MADKVYYPPEIQDESLGSIEGSGNTTVGKTYDTSTYKPVTQADKQFPPKYIAYDLISTSLDSRTKKIKGEFQFSKEGALIIGGYVPNESGEVALTPNGMIAKNVNGETTFVLDATTGDAFFKGTVETGAVIAGSVIITGRLIVPDEVRERVWLGKLGS